jgi:uncharacterized protein
MRSALTDKYAIVAVVALDEGPNLLSNIVDCQPEEVRCDMPVRAVWQDVTEEITLSKFRPLLHDKV